MIHVNVLETMWPGSPDIKAPPTSQIEMRLRNIEGNAAGRVISVTPLKKGMWVFWTIIWRDFDDE